MNRIKELRQERGLKQTDLATALNTTRQAVSRYETGERGLDVETIFALCDLFDVTADYLIGRSTVPKPVITEADWLLLDAYHRATLKDRGTVDHILAEYRAAPKEKSAG